MWCSCIWLHVQHKPVEVCAFISSGCRAGGSSRPTALRRCRRPDLPWSSLQWHNPCKGKKKKRKDGVVSSSSAHAALWWVSSWSRDCNSASDWLVVSPGEHLVLRSDDAVDAGVGSLCWALDQKTEVLDELPDGTHQVPRDLSVHNAGVHRVGHHT